MGAHITSEPVELPAPEPVPATRCVPPGRLRTGVIDGHVHGYSLISPEAWETLTATGRLACEPEHITPDFQHAYDWLRTQMAARLGSDPNRYPIWLWARITRARLISTVRRTGGIDPGDVLVTLRIPAERVLLSHFEQWHYVLNGWLCTAEDTDDAILDNWYDRLEAGCPDWRMRPVPDWPTALRREIEASWERIFDRSLYPRSDCWQGCVAELLATDVADAVIPT